ncbi:hypothetical protein I6A60_35970 [Frankia sp. AgB1.9]|uniref:hypothetical protein n=1 Tax=unclassified Frankia TaxID=2632575 RepID=UPI001932CD0B|nr:MULTISPECIES: hypothetical protein [unclassified Frankia]MBL7487783.1 hypothetical protein [Frankia sp. AgW1.1]MBL7553212.1 hypothetical protein [Frankia sp. AgB1.9]MBL7622943.1 hypothetical protein [Frankia sp. AgB1.8]
MPDLSSPVIPLSLAHLPTAGGLAVPWITARSGGRSLFGAIDRDRTDRALTGRLCGVCGHRLDERLLLLMRLSDLPRRCTPEPALHPSCAHYTIAACPMVGGRAEHYRTVPLPLDPTTTAPTADASARHGAPAEPWFAVWLTDYQVITDHGTLAASYAHTAPLRIRPITWRLPPLP